MRRIELSTGVGLAYQEFGDRGGPAVVMVHAWVESSRSFDRLIALLPASLRVLAVDLRGHGESDAPDEGYQLESLGADVAAFLDALALPSAVLVGSSSGGYVAQQVAVASPNRVSGLVLIGSPPSLLDKFPPSDEIDGLTDPIDPQWVRAFLDVMPRYHEVPDWYLDQRITESARTPARVWQRSLRGLIESQPPMLTGPISAPTLILWGERDGLLPYQGQADLAARIPGAVLRTYEGVGHLVLWEQPERVASDLVAFLAGLSHDDRGA